MRVVILKLGILLTSSACQAASSAWDEGGTTRLAYSEMWSAMDSIEARPVVPYGYVYGTPDLRWPKTDRELKLARSIVAIFPGETRRRKLKLKNKPLWRAILQDMPLEVLTRKNDANLSWWAKIFAHVRHKRAQRKMRKGKPWQKVLDRHDVGRALCGGKGDTWLRDRINEPSGARCSGVLVGSQIVATAGHCLGGREPSEYFAAIDFDKGTRRIRRSRVRRVTHRCDSAHGDVTLLVLEHEFPGPEKKSWGVEPLPIYQPPTSCDGLRCLAGKPVLAIGHPLGMPQTVSGGIRGENQYAMLGVCNRGLRADLDLMPHSSGTPVFVREHGAWQLVANVNEAKRSELQCGETCCTFSTKRGQYNLCRDGAALNSFVDIHDGVERLQMQGVEAMDPKEWECKPMPRSDGRRRKKRR